MTDKLAPILSSARYAKGKIAVHCPSDGSGMKTRAMRIAAALPSRYSNRERAYIMSPSAAKRLQDIFDAGDDAELEEKNGILDWVLA